MCLDLCLLLFEKSDVDEMIEKLETTLVILSKSL